MKKSVLLVSGALALSLLMGCGQKAEAPQSFAVDAEKLTLRAGVDDAATNIYTDGSYDYYVVPGEDTAYMIALSDTTMAAIEKRFKAENILPREEADARLKGYVAVYFPAYSSAHLEISCNETGSPIEYYCYTVCEYDGINRLNVASLSLAYDGTLASVTGTHNTPDVFDGSDTFTAEEIQAKAEEYMLSDPAAAEEGFSCARVTKLIYNGEPCWCVEFALSGSAASETKEIYLDPHTGAVLFLPGGIVF